MFCECDENQYNSHKRVLPVAQCKCCCAKENIKGKFGVAYLVDSPNTKCNPCGWEVEFNDTPSQVEYNCKRMIEWITCPPLGGYQNNSTKLYCCSDETEEFLSTPTQCCPCQLKKDRRQRKKDCCQAYCCSNQQNMCSCKSVNKHNQCCLDLNNRCSCCKSKEGKKKCCQSVQKSKFYKRKYQKNQNCCCYDDQSESSSEDHCCYSNISEPCCDCPHKLNDKTKKKVQEKTKTDTDKIKNINNHQIHHVVSLKNSSNIKKETNKTSEKTPYTLSNKQERKEAHKELIRHSHHPPEKTISANKQHNESYMQTELNESEINNVEYKNQESSLGNDNN
ncbi:uncharacterized protein LOC115885247 [Sitophilus oryzae]|uniref:Uncharacterized protein LOC115885247 n=1 Tax=Sitophilus oryzae TaxID=7048 RepID=A0A6J2YAJ5_SITOR|nr:uncharacterized protein LOC115885247 [Sitophilus oryzae]